jgi:glycosyltransferase involved in cell wall biosynthesis
MAENELTAPTVVSFLPTLRPFHVNKDIGQMTYYIGRYFGVQSAMVTYEKEPPDDPYAPLCDEYAPGLKVISLRKRVLFRKDMTFPFFLLRNGKYIRVLYLYQFGPGYRYYMHFMLFLYKMLNRKGIAHIRFEADFNHIDENALVRDTKFIRRHLIGNYNNLINYFGIIGTIDDVKKYLLPEGRNVVKMQINGFNDEVLTRNIRTVRDYSGRENLIVLSGRLDSPEKGLDVFLKAIDQIDLDDWNIVLLGGDKGKVTEIVASLSLKKDTIGRIRVHGHVEYKELCDTLNKSKIYVLASLIDGMPMVAAEAMACGDVVVSARHYGMEIALENGRIGKLFEIGNHDELAGRISELINNPAELEMYHARTIHKAWNEFTWKSIIRGIYQ